MTADSLTSVRELDSRWTNGIEVRLLWRQLDGRLFVAVVDRRSGESFRIDLREGDRPLDIFQHPFAYAADQRRRRDLPRTLEVVGEPVDSGDGPPSWPLF
jgi:hypothetical protein